MTSRDEASSISTAKGAATSSRRSALQKENTLIKNGENHGHNNIFDWKGDE
jgi:hypothetical protein